MACCVTRVNNWHVIRDFVFRAFCLVLSYYRDSVVSIYSHTVIARRINIQVGTVSATSLFVSLFYDCYRQPITTVSAELNVTHRTVLWITYPLVVTDILNAFQTFPRIMFVTQFIVNSSYWSEAMYTDDAKRNESNIEAMYRSVVKKRCWETIEKRWKRWNGFEN